MGQYYRPSILKKNWKTAKQPVITSLLCYDYGNGAKLMEHSYIGNRLARSMEYLLANAFKGYPFVWVGDYADEVTTRTGQHNIYDDANRTIYKDYDGDSDEKRNTYSVLCESIPQLPEWSEVKDWNPYETIPYYRYLVNYTKKEYCLVPYYKENESQVNPLPLLTCSGNGRGGGDYHIEDKRVGSWAYNRIGLTNDEEEVKGFKVISGIFALDY